MELMGKREQELSKIYRYSGRGFFFTYLLGAASFYFLKGSTPYFKNVFKHLVLCTSGTFVAAFGAERLASEFYYNKLLIQLADKYNFTPEEVMDLQRNLNQYYIKKDREQDIERS